MGTGPPGLPGVHAGGLVCDCPELTRPLRGDCRDRPCGSSHSPRGWEVLRSAGLGDVCLEARSAWGGRRPLSPSICARPCAGACLRFLVCRRRHSRCLRASPRASALCIVLRRWQAWGEWHRRITQFGIVRSDGSVTTEVEDAAEALAAHRAPVFGSGGPIPPQAVETFLRVWPDVPCLATIDPLSIDDLRSAISLTRSTSSGLPYSVWDAAGDSWVSFCSKLGWDCLGDSRPPPTSIAA